MKNLIILFAVVGVLSLIAANYYAGGNISVAQEATTSALVADAPATSAANDNAHTNGLDIDTLKAKASDKTIAPTVPEGAVDVKPTIYGEADAPIIIEEFASFSCSHCVSFHREILPEVKKALVDTGLAQIRIYSFVRNNADVSATMLLQCQDNNKQRMGFNNALYNGQEQWTGASDINEALKTIATVGGMSAEAFEVCMTNEELEKQVISSRQWFDKQVGVNATPYFRIGSEVVKGARSVENFVTAIENELAKQ